LMTMTLLVTSSRSSSSRFAIMSSSLWSTAAALPGVLFRRRRHLAF
jgi:hypothetical protein